MLNRLRLAPFHITPIQFLQSYAAVKPTSSCAVLECLARFPDARLRTTEYKDNTPAKALNN
jgi:hypothetical protein